MARRHRWRRALAFARPHRAAAAGIVTLVIGAAALSAVEPLVLKIIFDRMGVASPRFDRIWPWAIAFTGLALGRELVAGIGNWWLWRTRLRLQHRLLEAAVHRLHRLPIEYHRTRGVGAIMTKLDRGVQGAVAAFGDVLANLLPAFGYLLVALVVMFRISWILSVAVIVMVPLPALLAAWAAPTQVARESRLLERWSQLYSRFNEVLGGLVTVRSFAMEEDEKRRFLHGVEEANTDVVRGVGFDTRVGAAQNAVVVLARIATVTLGAWLVIEGQETVGTVVAFLGYVGGLFGPVQGLSGLYTTLKKATVSIDSLFGILDAQESIGDAPDAFAPDRIRGHIRFDRVRFRYRSDQPWVIDGVSLEIEPGEVVALVGPSGSGKSTLTALLQRFYDPLEGTVHLDDHDVRELKQQALRRQIGVVLQEPVLFNDTVANNIAYGRADATMTEIRAAAEAAQAAQFVEQLPDGYDAMVGERGSRLSVGQRQRIAIARAMLKDPPVVVLDEATSALDAHTEARVQMAIRRLLAGRTALVIAHRLSTVVHADRIVVLRHGRIEQMGTHRELMRDREGHYASLVRHQTAGLLPDHFDPSGAPAF